MWFVLGEKCYGGRGYTSRAVAELLSIGFRDLRLETISAWAVSTNVASGHVLQNNGFRLVGRLRQCPYIDGRACDRLLFDILSSEHSIQCKTTPQ